jgi:hypothetical protein
MKLASTNDEIVRRLRVAKAAVKRMKVKTWSDDMAGVALVLSNVMDFDERDMLGVVANWPELMAEAGYTESAVELTRQKYNNNWGKASVVVFGIPWVLAGKPTVEVSHRLAASLMATSVASDFADHVVFPWPSFLIRVAPGVVSAPDVGDITHVLVRKRGVAEGEQCVVLVTNMRGRPTAFPQRHLSEFGVVPEAFMRRADALPDAMEANARALLMIDRLVTGVCLELSSDRRLQAELAKRGRSGFDSESADAPASDLHFKLTRDVRVDCRHAVSAYLGGGDRPTVQTLVRGHWKRQRFGEGAALVRWIQIEPYWRGPEDAPIAVRSHRLDVARAVSR